MAKSRKDNKGRVLWNHFGEIDSEQAKNQTLKGLLQDICINTMHMSGRKERGRCFHHCSGYERCGMEALYEWKII